MSSSSTKTQPAAASSPLVDTVRRSLITHSIAAASQRMTKQRRVFASSSEDAAAANFSRFAQEHASAIASQLCDFGCTASVSTPGALMETPKDGAVLVSSSRVTAACSAGGGGGGGGGDRGGGHRVALGLDDGSVTVWSVEDGAWLQHGLELADHSSRSKLAGFGVQGIASSFSLSSPLLLASAHRNGSLAIWKLPSEESDLEKSKTNQTSDDAAAAAASSSPKQFSPVVVVPNAHRRLHNSGASFLDDGSQQVDPSPSSSSSSASLRRCAFAPPSSSSSSAAPLLATTGSDGTVRIWSVSDSNVDCLMCLANGLDPATTTTATTSASSPSSAAAAAPMPSTRCVAFHPDGAVIAVGDASGSLTLWDLRDASRIYSSVGAKPLHTGRVNAVATSSNGYNICTGGDDGLVFCFDMRRLGGGGGAGQSASTSSPSHHVWRRAAHGDAVTDVIYGRSGSFLGGDVTDSPVLLTGGLDGVVVAWDAWTGEQKWRSLAGDSPAYVASTKISSAPMLPSVRCLAIVEGSNSNNNRDDGQKQDDTATLVVARREPAWLAYGVGGASLGGGARTVQTTAQLVSTVVAQQQENDGNGDSDDSDDDVLGALRGK